MSLGVIGVGHIGRLVAKKASALGMNVYGYDANGISDVFVEKTGIKMLI